MLVGHLLLEVLEGLLDLAGGVDGQREEHLDLDPLSSLRLSGAGKPLLGQRQELRVNQRQLLLDAGADRKQAVDAQAQQRMALGHLKHPPLER